MRLPLRTWRRIRSAASRRPPGVERVLVGRLQERSRGPRIGHAAAHEDLREHARDAELRGQALGGREYEGSRVRRASWWVTRRFMA